MSVHRLLSRREKHHHKSRDDHGNFGGIFVLDEKKKSDKEEDKKVKAILGRLQRLGITIITEANIEYALQAPSVQGDTEEAFRLCMLLEDTYEGLVKPYNPTTKLLGAVNRDGVTCFLDALLFAMFARLDSFEAMLYNSLEDVSRKKLAGILRLWVNMLRSGRLITTDITRHLQAVLTECGWAAASDNQQQDASEAFGFITGELQLPLLTLKMDLYHTGKEDPNDDHKFVNERLLEVAVLTEPPEGSDVITLEDCLENYFNNRIEIKRHLEQQRRNTLRSKSSTEKLSGLEVETVEYLERTDSPVPESPAKLERSESQATASSSKTALDKLRPIGMRRRTDSIFSQRRVAPISESNIATDLQRKASLRTEVLMPAWQFFKLLPWYTDNIPTSDAQVAAHFSRKRPVLGICLKRYSMTNHGKSVRLDTYIDIPLEIAVPDFVSDDNMDEDGPLVGNFKLVLQSVVCHRGRSVHSGHYISLVRGHAANAAKEGQRPDSSSSDDESDPWMLFDDLARERVRYVDIAQALKDECPYLLFYQVQPIAEDLAFTGLPPTYFEATSHENFDPTVIAEKGDLPEYSDNENAIVESASLSPTMSTGVKNTDEFDFAPSSTVPSTRANSIDAGTMLDESRRGRSSLSSNRPDGTTIETGSIRTNNSTASAPSTPLEESRSSFLGITSRRGSRQSGTSKKTKSRAASTNGEGAGNRMSLGLNISKITSRMSRSDLPALTAITSNSGDTATESTISVIPTGTTSDGSVISVGTASIGSLEHEAVMIDAGPTAAEKAPGVGVTLDKGKLKKGKEKKEKSHHHHGHKTLRKKGEVPDRDCAVM